MAKILGSLLQVCQTVKTVPMRFFMITFSGWKFSMGIGIMIQFYPHPNKKYWEFPLDKALEA
ncbi:MAG: hypothetical protein JWQ09_5509 [Segetibacter sp.]|nr:hypothetical protein [Segetibacter sp.]